MTPAEYKQELQSVVAVKVYPFEVMITCSDDVPFPPDEDMPDDWVMLCWKWTYEGQKYGSCYWHCDFDPNHIERHLQIMVEHFEHSKDAIKAQRSIDRSRFS